jgi:hypothetical protein
MTPALRDVVNAWRARERAFAASVEALQHPDPGPVDDAAEELRVATDKLMGAVAVLAATADKEDQ